MNTMPELRRLQRVMNAAKAQDIPMEVWHEDIQTINRAEAFINRIGNAFRTSWPTAYGTHTYMYVFTVRITWPFMWWAKWKHKRSKAT